MINTTYRLDNNHLGVRIAVLIAMLAGFMGGLFGIPALPTCSACRGRTGRC